jgi:hypothetical protein
MVVSVTVFLFTTADMDFLLSLFIIGVISLWLFRDTLGHWFCSINDGKHNQN